METKPETIAIHTQPERAPMRPRKLRREKERRVGGKGLSLERRLGESIDVFGPCRITLVRVGQGKARLAIDAAAHVPILRSELVDRDVRQDGEGNRDTAA